MKRVAIILAAGGIMLAWAAALRAEDPNATYERLYGGEAKKLRSSDLPAFAQRLLDDSDALKDDPALAELLFAKACDFQARSLNSPAKGRVGEALIDRFVLVGSAQEAAGKLLDANNSYQQAFKIAAGKESILLPYIKERLKSMQAKADRQKKLADLLARWKASPDDPAASKDVAWMYVLELDKPGDAAPYLKALGDQLWKTYVPLAAADANTLEEPVLKELAAWYNDLAGKSPAGKVTAYARAARYYELFLRKHGRQDAEALLAKKSLAAIEKEMGSALLLGDDRLVVLNLVKGVSMRMLFIPPGKFTMGSPEREGSRHPDEGQREVTLPSGFHMGMCHVTRGQFAAFVKDASRKTDAERHRYSSTMDRGRWTEKEGAYWQNPGFEQDDDHPVVLVSYYDASAFCDWMSRKTGKTIRLPSEQQWEYACRAGTTTAYIWGDDPAAGRGWCNGPDLSLRKVSSKALVFGWDDGYAFTSPAGRFKPNALGLYDMVGNAMQWTSDRYDAKTTGETTRIGPGGDRYMDFYRRIVRGGAWYGLPELCRSACRAPYYPDHAGADIGFRVVMDPTPPSDGPAFRPSPTYRPVRPRPAPKPGPVPPATPPAE